VESQHQSESADNWIHRLRKELLLRHQSALHPGYAHEAFAPTPEHQKQVEPAAGLFGGL
jgi:hypothetical protein